MCVFITAKWVQLNFVSWQGEQRRAGILKFHVDTNWGLLRRNKLIKQNRCCSFCAADPEETHDQARQRPTQEGMTIACSATELRGQPCSLDGCLMDDMSYICCVFCLPEGIPYSSPVRASCNLRPETGTQPRTHRFLCCLCTDALSAACSRNSLIKKLTCQLYHISPTLQASWPVKPSVSGHRTQIIQDNFFSFYASINADGNLKNNSTFSLKNNNTSLWNSGRKLRTIQHNFTWDVSAHLCKYSDGEKWRNRKITHKKNLA